MESTEESDLSGSMGDLFKLAELMTDLDRDAQDRLRIIILRGSCRS